MDKVIFNKSKIGWFKVSAKELVKNFEDQGLKVYAVDENFYIKKHYNKKTDIVNLDEVYKGIGLYEICIYNICNDLMIFKDELQFDLHQDVIFRWYNIAKLIIDDFFILFNKNKFSLVIIVNGHSLLDACLLAFAKLYNVKFLSIEGTSQENRIVWDDVSGKVITYNLAKKYFENFFNLIDKEEVITYAELFKRSVFENKREEHLSNVENTGYFLDRPFVLFLGQVYPDAAQLFALQGDLNNPIKIIENTINACKELNIDLVIKLHPKEHKGVGPVFAKPYSSATYQRIEKYNSGSVHIDNNNVYNTFNLIQKAQAVVTVNSQAGLEACLYDKPVLTYFKSFYSGLGFTYDFIDKQSLKEALYDLINKNLKFNRDLLKAQSFYFIFFEKYCIENSSVSLFKKAMEVGGFSSGINFMKLFMKIKKALKNAV